MTVIHTVSQRSLGSQSSQSVLQQSYFIAVLVIALGLIILRIVVLRWRNQSIASFFRMGARSQQPCGPQNQDRPNYGLPYSGVQLTPLPAVYRTDRRTQAADIDEHGRRLGPAGEDGDGKDALPAYDNFDRPPKYIEAGWSHGHLVEQSAVIPSPEGNQGGMAHPNNTDRVPGDSSDPPLDDTHDMAATPARRDLSTN